MFVNWIVFFLGLGVLILGAKWLVSGASSLAENLGLSPIFIGLTVVAFGTSAPELVVNITASLKGSTEMALGNIVGSNIANILFILGISALVSPLAVKANTTWKEIPFSLLAVTLLGVMASDVMTSNSISLIVSRLDGIILLSFFAAFLVYTVSIIRESTIINPAEDKPQYRRPGLSIFLVLLGLTALFFGGKWIVDSAVVIARSLGVNEGLIGLTIVAVGTSLPEFATSIKASWDGKNDIAIGNIVGSNIFNVFFILGTPAVIKPIPVPNSFIFDIAVVIIASLALFAIMFTGKKNHIIGRVEGLLFVLGYAWYVWYSIQR